MNPYEQYREELIAKYGTNQFCGAGAMTDDLRKSGTVELTEAETDKSLELFWEYQQE